MAKTKTPALPTPATHGMTAADVYKTHLTGFPDVLTVPQVSEALSVSTKTVYGLLNNGKIAYLPVGREKRIPKLYLLHYLKLLDCNAPID